MSRTRGLAALVLLYLVIAHVIPAPASITPQGWRQTAIFICVIAGMVTDPLPASALVLLGLTAMAVNGTPMPEVLGGFAEPSVWLVIVAMLIAKAMLDCGLARRIALLFVRAVGKTSLGVAYALQMTDVTLASGVPSITARSAGMILPVARSIAELFDSQPDHTAAPAGRVPDRGDVPGIGGGVRDVHHRPGQQPAGRQPRAEAGQRAKSPRRAGSWRRSSRACSRAWSCRGSPIARCAGSHLHARGAGVCARRAAQDGAAQPRRMDHPAGVRRRRPDLADHGVSRARRHDGRADRARRAAGHRHA